MQQLTISFNEQSELPLYAQIYEYVKEEMKAGRIPAYTRLPSTRRLAEFLHVSRATVQKAYDQLQAEGYLDAEPCRGYYTAQLERLESVSVGRKTTSPAAERTDDGAWTAGMNGDGRRDRESAGSQKSTEGSDSRRQKREKDVSPAWICDFSPAGVDLTSFPYKTWRRLMREIMLDETGRIFSKGMAQGEESLRQAIAEYLREARGVSCRPDQIVIGAGSEYLLMLISLLMGSGTRIAMENPTYVQAYRVLTSLGHPVVPIAMDSMGMRADLLRREQVQLAYCMPSHQYPTGIVMPISRRMELLNWARERDGYLIEDDYDSEFRYQGRPIPALQSVDREDRVIYLGSFSRAIAPAIRVSYMVLPERLLESYRGKCGFYSCTVPRADQEILTRLMTQGSFERHLNLMRGIYREKRNCLLQELSGLGPAFTVQGDAAGVHLLIHSHGRLSEAELVQSAERERVKVYGLSDHCIDAGEAWAKTGCVILGFAGVTGAEIQAGAAALKRAWDTDFS